MYNVSSWFRAKAESQQPQLLRKMFINSTEVTSYVVKWPTIKRKHDSLRPGSITVTLANEDGTFNDYISDTLNIMNIVRVDIGFTDTTAAGSHAPELISPYQGFIERVSFDRGSVRFSVQDKFKKLAEGTLRHYLDDAPYYYAGSTSPAHAFWEVCNNSALKGPLDSTSNSANVDIDWDSFSTWKTQFDSDSVGVAIYFDGESHLEAIREIARATASTIIVEGTKIVPRRFTGVSSIDYTLTDDNILSITAELDDSEVVNHAMVKAGYNTATDSHTITVLDVKSDSINSYGMHSKIEASSKIWYINSQSALNLAQRKTQFYKLPIVQYSVRTPLCLLPYQIGDAIAVTDTSIGVIGQTMRLMELSLNMDNLTMDATLDNSQLAGPFMLDSSLLDGEDLLL